MAVGRLAEVVLPPAETLTEFFRHKVADFELEWQRSHPTSLSLPEECRRARKQSRSRNKIRAQCVKIPRDWDMKLRTLFQEALVVCLGRKAAASWKIIMTFPVYNCRLQVRTKLWVVMFQKQENLKLYSKFSTNMDKCLPDCSRPGDLWGLIRFCPQEWNKRFLLAILSNIKYIHPASTFKNAETHVINK